MSIVWDPITVSDSIAGLSISGVSIKKVDQIPDSAQGLCPIIFPQPTGFIADTVATNMSFGTMGSEKQNMEYSLHYVFLFAELGSGESQLTPYKPLLSLLKTAINVILNNDVVSGLVDMKLQGIDALGAIEDPAGNRYWGALFSLRCLEFTQ